MKKTYSNPTFTVTIIDEADIIACSDLIGYGGDDAGHGSASARSRDIFDD